jgi:hypothetical protein
VDMRWPLAITKAREARGLTQREVGERMKLSYVALGNRERGVTTITEEWLLAFLVEIGMEREEFLTIVGQVPVHSLTPSEDIPLYPNLASAGKRAFVPEDTGEEWNTTVDRGNATFHPRAFAVTIEGDSMEPRVLHGDVAICEPVDDEYGVGTLTDGKMVIVFGGARETVDYQNSEIRLARPMVVPTGGMIGLWAWISDGAELRKANAKYSPIRIPAQHDGTLRIAVVVEIRRRV